jgi:hypothetical protein
VWGKSWRGVVRRGGWQFSVLSSLHGHFSFPYYKFEAGGGCLAVVSFYFFERRLCRGSRWFSRECGAYAHEGICLPLQPGRILAAWCSRVLRKLTTENCVYGRAATRFNVQGL